MTAPPSRSLRVLVVEDNAINRKVTGKILEHAAHRPAMVENGEAALELLEKETFDVILMDINMPGTSGLDVIKLIRFAQLGAYQVPIVAVTADATPETRVACKEAGANDCLTKPVKAESLLATVERIVADAKKSYSTAEASTDDNSSATAVTACPDSFVDHAAGADLETLRGLESLGGNGTFLEEVIADFIEDARSIMKEMREALAADDVGRYRDCAHALRSSTSNVGALNVAHLCAKMMRITWSDFQRNGAEHMRQVETELDRFRLAAARYIEGRTARLESGAPQTAPDLRLFRCLRSRPADGLGRSPDAPFCEGRTA